MYADFFSLRGFVNSSICRSVFTSVGPSVTRIFELRGYKVHHTQTRTRIHSLEHARIILSDRNAGRELTSGWWHGVTKVLLSPCPGNQTNVFYCMHGSPLRLPLRPSIWWICSAFIRQASPHSMQQICDFRCFRAIWCWSKAAVLSIPGCRAYKIDA